MPLINLAQQVVKQPDRLRLSKAAASGDWALVSSILDEPDVVHPERGSKDAIIAHFRLITGADASFECCFCKAVKTGWGECAMPVMKDNSEKCCNACLVEKVVPARRAEADKAKAALEAKKASADK